MKTLSLKSMMISWIAVIIALAGLWSPVFGQTTSTTLARVEKEKACVNKDLANINQLRGKVQLLEKKADDEFDASITGTKTRSRLLKAEADLSRAKVYLRTDKSDLLDAHQAYIEEGRANVKQEKAQLKEAQKNLNLALAAGNASAGLYAQEVVTRKNNLAQGENALKVDITSRNNDLIAVNKKIREVDGESSVTLAFEDSWAKNQTAMVEK